MKKIITFTFIALTAMANFCAAAVAPGEQLTVGNFNYQVIDNSTIECMGLANGKNPISLLIPGYVKYGSTTYRVKRIHRYAFKNNATATVLRVGWGVSSIDLGAFEQSALKYIYLPSSLDSIHALAFYNNSLVRVAVAGYYDSPRILDGNDVFNPDALPEIVTNPVYGLRTRGKIVNDELWKHYDKDGTIEINGALANDFDDGNDQYYVMSCKVTDSERTAMLVGIRNTKTTVNLPNVVYNRTCNEYGGGAADISCYLNLVADATFRDNTKITTIGSASTDASHLEWFGSWVFYNCTALTKVYLPSGLRGLNVFTFHNCTSLKTIEVNANNPYLKSIDGVLYRYYKSDNQLTLEAFPPAYPYATYTFPDGMTSINDYAFNSNQNLTSIVVPYGVTTIGSLAFSDMKQCTTLAIPSSVTNFNSQTFNYMSSVNALYFNFKEIPQELARPSQNGALHLYNINPNATLYLPFEANINAYKADYDWGASFALIVEGGAYDINSNLLYFNVTSTDPYTDDGIYEGTADGQVEMVYPPSRTNYATLIVPDEVTSLGKKYAVTGISTHACDRFTNLTTLNGGNCVKTISNQAFKYCSSLSTVKFPHLVSIGDSAFYNLSRLKTFTWGDRLATIGDYSFHDTGFDSEISLPETVTKIGMKAFYGCKSLTGLVLNNGGAISWQFYGNNASGFKCYVPLKSFYTFNNFATWTSNGVSAATQMHPFVKPDTEWSVFSCHKPLTLASEAEYYAATGYNEAKQVITTAAVTGNVAALTGLLMKASPGTVYRFTTATTGNTPATNLLQGVGERNLKVENSSEGNSNFVFNSADNKFHAIDNYKYYQPGEAYLHLSYPSNTTTIQIDKIYVPDIIRGDINGDNKVDVSDVTTLINMILGSMTEDFERTDLNGDGSVDVSDVTTLINIILGKV